MSQPLIAMIVILVAPLATGVKDPATPFLGDWTGMVRQAGYDDYPVRLRLMRLVRGEVAGTVEYSTLNCRGELWLQHVRRRMLILEERYAPGNRRCVNRGLVRLSVESDNALSYTWFYPDGRAGARATLMPARPIGAPPAQHLTGIDSKAGPPKPTRMREQAQGGFVDFRRR